ncbi:hypothetical protein XA68_13923 [Ophiocordyceps unilateralis]|uniref:3-hydroxyacyl-CoA dehydrogenase-like protein n=1 Tax=Ophiocordyceps unilateralis TaxID=268505 RepID=A0A2A9PBT1_OPHUN|nr:hypothetical protein XA68_13923 [Ophiocordyceps unilateralis]
MKLPSTADRPVVVLGGGVLGRRVATTWAAGGYKVHIRDPSEEQRTSALHYCENNMSEYPGEKKNGKVHVFEDLASAVKNAWLIIEAVPEKLSIKISTFADLEKLAPEDALLCSNSSSYKSREMIEERKESTKQRTLNMHYYMPPGNLVVELMTNGETSPDIFPFLVDKCKDVGLHPYVARKESTGLIFNRMWAAIKRESLYMLSEGVTTPEELDGLWKEMWGSKNGPVAMMDAVGLDTVSMIEQHYINERGLPNTPIKFLKKYIDEDRLGAKSVKGGIYPAGATTKAKGENAGHHDNVHAPLLYFLDMGLDHLNDPFHSGRVLVGSPDGRPLKELVTGLMTPDGIGISLKAGKIFWTSMGIPADNDGSVCSCNLDGSDVKEVIPKGKVHTPKQLYMDHTNSKLYFCDREGLGVWRCNFDGSNQELLVKTGDWKKDDESQDQLRWCVGVTVSPATGKFYWTQKGNSKASQGRIFRANIETPSGTKPEKRKDIECLFQRLPECIDLEIDETNNTLYWSDRGELPFGNTINRADLSKVKPPQGNTMSLPGKDYDIVTRGMHEAIGISLDIKNRHIYSCDMGGTVYMTDLDGGNKKKFYEDCGTFTGITHVHV